MTKVVYRSSHPDVLAHWDNTASAEAQTAWRERVETAIADLGFPGRRFATQNDIHVVGVEHPHGDPVPEGWRRDRKNSDVIVPARRTKAGRDIDDKLTALARPCPRHDLPGGMPKMAFSGLALMHPGVERHGETVYVSWSGELTGRDAECVDTAVWQRIKLSDYYAVLEAAQDAASEASIS